MSEHNTRIIRRIGVTDAQWVDFVKARMLAENKHDPLDKSAATLIDKVFNIEFNRRYFDDEDVSVSRLAGRLERLAELCEKIAKELNQSPVDMIEVYTSAPEEYDSFGTFTLDADAGCTNCDSVNKKRLRQVAIRREHYEYQTGRYASGLHFVTTYEEAIKFPSVYTIYAHRLEEALNTNE